MQTSTLLSWRSRSHEAKPEFSWNRKESFAEKHQVLLDVDGGGHVLGIRLVVGACPSN